MAAGFYMDGNSIYVSYRKQIKGRKIALKYFPGITVESPFDWIKEKQRAKDPDITKRLNKIQTAIDDIEKEVALSDLNNELFAELIEEKIFGTPKFKPQTSFFAFADEFIKTARAEKGHEYANSFRTILNKLEEYDPELTFESMTKAFYRDFKKWLEKQTYTKKDPVTGEEVKKQFSKNYIGSLFRDLKRILNTATDDEINENLAYEKFEIEAEDVYNIYLSEEEIERIYNLQISDSDIMMLQQEGKEREVFLSNSNIQRQRDALNRARKIFIVGCWTGLRCENYLSIDPEIQVDLKNGFIHAIANKKGPKLKIPLHRLVRQIVEKDGFPQTVSQQKLNEHIKVLGKLAGINETIIFSRTEGGTRKEYALPKYKMITTHTARRSFASNLTLAGVPKQYIMAVTGHKTERAFNKYIQAVLKDQLTEKLKDYDVWG